MTVNDFYIKRYNNLIGYCNDKNIEHDFLNDVYLKMIKVFTGDTSNLSDKEYYSYTIKSLWNLMLDNEKSLRKRRTVHYTDSPNIQDELEYKLQIEEQYDKDTILYKEEIEYLTKMLFKYIQDQDYDDKEIYIIKSYFLEDKMTYKKLELKININLHKIKRTIRFFKNDVKTNFIPWLNKKLTV